jgi:mono/diheme cytochrome c family protein
MRNVLLVLAVALILVGNSACAHHATAPAGSQDASSPQFVAATPDVARGDRGRGQTVFTKQCSACHGASGREGGVGPSLAGEVKKKSAVEISTWIQDPRPPMPKLYPGVLDERDVADLAAYVSSL